MSNKSIIAESYGLSFKELTYEEFVKEGNFKQTTDRRDMPMIRLINYITKYEGRLSVSNIQSCDTYTYIYCSNIGRCGNAQNFTFTVYSKKILMEVDFYDEETKYYKGV